MQMLNGTLVLCNGNYIRRTTIRNNAFTCIHNHEHKTHQNECKTHHANHIHRNEYSKEAKKKECYSLKNKCCAVVKNARRTSMNSD